jgi:cellulose synthase/poly-beta-1,6-N-acetylglucosamine synthase-like glycosyltransferase
MLAEHPLFLVVLGWWYIGRSVIAAIGHVIHNRWRDGIDPDGDLPSLSVLIPAYNESGTITSTIEVIPSHPVRSKS